MDFSSIFSKHYFHIRKSMTIFASNVETAAQRPPHILLHAYSKDKYLVMI